MSALLWQFLAFAISHNIRSKKNNPSLIVSHNECRRAAFGLDIADGLYAQSNRLTTHFFIFYLQLPP
jgi:hypothetical protein